MKLGQVIGTVVATQQIDGIKGLKLLAVQPLDHNKKPSGRALIAADTVRSGPNDIIYYVSSREASQALEETFVPVDAAIIGIVDSIC